MKKISLILIAFLVSTVIFAQKNTLVNPPDYQIYKDNVDNQFASFSKTMRLLHEKLSLTSMAFTILEGAIIVYRVGKPNIRVNFASMVNGTGELCANSQSGKTPDVMPDARGEATIFCHYTDTRKMTAPVQVQIVAEAEGNSRKAYVYVGLGLASEKISAIPEQKYIYSPSSPYAFALSVKSTCFPKLNLVNYHTQTHESHIRGNKMVGLALDCSWVNEPDGAPKDITFIKISRFG